MRALIPFLLAGFGSAVLLVPVARRVSHALGLVAHPTVDRWHRRSVAKLGGVAMALAFGLVVPWTGLSAQGWPLLMCTALMCLLGLVDDVRPVRPATKLLGQVLIAALLLYLQPPPTFFGQVLLDYGIGFFWLIGVTNAFNLLDNIDGLAAGVGAIAASFLALSLMSTGHGATDPLALALWVFVGVALGFLVFNFQPASVFMGDSGSHLIGFFIAGTALVARPAVDGAAFWPTAVGPVVMLLIPIFDTAFVTITRGLAGRGIFQGGRDHTSHRLVALGISERRAVLVLYALTLVGGLVGLTFHEESRYAWGLATLYSAGLAGLGIYLGHLDASHGADAPATLLPTELTTRYRAYEVALDAILIGVAYYLAFGLRFADDQFFHFLPYFTQSLPLVIALQLGGLALAGKYRQVWHGVGASELTGLMRGIVMGSAATVLAVLYLYRFEGFSRKVFFYDFVVLSTLLIAARAALSSLDDYMRRQRADGRAALIIGAGRGGALAVRELVQNPALGLVPYGFLDDDPAKLRSRVDGYRVLGTVADLDLHLAQASPRIATVVVAVRDLPPGQLDTILATCDARQIPVRRLRLALDETDWRDRTPGLVRFPDR